MRKILAMINDKNPGLFDDDRILKLRDAFEELDIENMVRLVFRMRMENILPATSRL
jgi:hypothetical protein